MSRVTRWEPDAPGRLRKAALELFEERGYEATTVEDIATRAGLTKRTFFRHFGDKREVLFADGSDFTDLFLRGLERAPASASPMEAVAAALEAAGEGFPAPHAHARRRAQVVAANAELQERELVKLASVSAALAAALRERGVEDPIAGVVAETALAVFRNAFERWVAAPAERPLTGLLRESLDALRAVAGSAPA
jgi:AcrR family transcriptional regulator